jgi:hypothetical protein
MKNFVALSTQPTNIEPMFLLVTVMVGVNAMMLFAATFAGIRLYDFAIFESVHYSKAGAMPIWEGLLEPFIVCISAFFAILRTAVLGSVGSTLFRSKVSFFRGNTRGGLAPLSAICDPFRGVFVFPTARLTLFVVPIGAIAMLVKFIQWLDGFAFRTGLFVHSALLRCYSKREYYIRGTA